MTRHRDRALARADGSGGPTSFLLQSSVVNVLLVAVVVILLVVTLASMT